MLISKIKYFFNRTGFVFALALLLCYFISDNTMINQAYMVRTLNAAIPNGVEYETFLNRLSSDQQSPNNLNIQSVNYYYKRIVHFRPAMTDALGLLGATQYALGQNENAVDSYNKALKNSPYFFWYPFNAGLIHFKNGKYDTALQYFQKAQQADPNKTLYKALNSPMIYAPLIAQYRGMTQKDLQQEYLTARKQLNQLMGYCFLKLKDTNNTQQLAKQSLESDPENRNFYLFLLAEQEWKGNKIQSAVNFAQLILTQDRNNIDALLLMREIADKQNQNHLVGQIDQEISRAAGMNRESYEVKLKSIPLRPY